MFGEKITVHPGDRLDENNDRVPSSLPDFDVEGCAIEFIGSEENQIRGRSGVFTKIKVFLTEPPPREITRFDDIAVRGLDYMVNGDPFAWVDPFDFDATPDTSGHTVFGYRAEG